MMSSAQRRNVWILIAAVFLFSVVLSEHLRPQHDQYLIAGRADTGDQRVDHAQRSFVANSSFEALISASLGVREVLASLMWVRADDYFHRGEYRPIYGMVRQITAIDPHQLDVYATGAWHMAYNFMDKRLIDEGIKFLEEGCKNNRTVYDLFFELGYMHYDKTKDYRKAVEAHREASTKRTTTGKVRPPAYVRHQLAHALEKMGDIDQSIGQWETNLQLARSLSKEENQSGPAGLNTNAALHNLYITRRRMNERLAAVAERERNAKEAQRLWQANVDLANEWLREFPRHPQVTEDLNRAVLQVDRLRSGKLRPVEPHDIKLKFTVQRLAPRLLRITGTVDVLDLSRVRVQFQDRDYERRASNGFDYKMDNCSLEWENVSVKKGAFRYDLKLNRDPADMGRAPEEIYPLKAEEYEISVTYNPRLQAAFIQDRYGWNGEGLTAADGSLQEDPERAGVMQGKRQPLRFVRKTVVIKRDEILKKEPGPVEVTPL